MKLLLSKQIFVQYFVFFLYLFHLFILVLFEFDDNFLKLVNFYILIFYIYLMTFKLSFQNINFVKKLLIFHRHHLNILI